MFQGLFPPGLETRVTGNVLDNGGLAGPDRGARRALTGLALVPGNPQVVQVLLGVPPVSDRFHTLFRVLLGKADPDQAVTAKHDQNPTDFAQQLRLIAVPGDCLVAFAENPQGAIYSEQRLLRTLNGCFTMPDQPIQGLPRNHDE